MSYNDRVDPRFGPGYPDCAGNTQRVSVRLDFGLGDVFTVQYQSGAVAPLLRAVQTIRVINNRIADPRRYKVQAAGHRVKGGYDITIAGSFSCRHINNPHDPTSKDPSPHSWPVAIDINPATNGWGSGLGDHPSWFRKAFLDEGFSWGGEWGDPMHYENLKWYGKWDGTYPKEEDELAFLSEKDQKDLKLFLDTLREDMGSRTDPTKPATAKGAGQRVAKTVKKSEGK